MHSVLCACNLYHIYFSRGDTYQFSIISAPSTGPESTFSHPEGVLITTAMHINFKPGNAMNDYW